MTANSNRIRHSQLGSRRMSQKQHKKKKVMIKSTEKKKLTGDRKKVRIVYISMKALTKEHAINNH